MPTKKGRTAKAPKKTKNNFVEKLIGVIFLSAALVVLLGPNYISTQQIKNSNDPIKINSKLLENKNQQDTPVRILIPSAQIDLSVVNAKIIGGYWELSETTASYGEGSGVPGTKSNTVIFAHARPGLFYNLKDAKLGDTIYVFSKNKWFRYKVNKITAVFPNETQVIQPTKSEVLTLYTCTGFEDEKRLIVQAVPQN